MRRITGISKVECELDELFVIRAHGEWRRWDKDKYRQVRQEIAAALAKRNPQVAYSLARSKDRLRFSHAELLLRWCGMSEDAQRLFAASAKYNLGDCDILAIEIPWSPNTKRMLEVSQEPRHRGIVMEPKKPWTLEQVLGSSAEVELSFRLLPTDPKDQIE